MSASTTTAREKPARRLTLSTGASFWAAGAIVFLPFAANTAASPLYRVYQAQFRFSATTLTLLFTVYIVVLLVTLLFLGSVSDYVGRRRVMLAGLATGAVACALFLIAHELALLFAARALQGVSVGLISGTASAALLDLRPESGITPVLSSGAPTGGQALGAVGASALAQYAPAPTHLVWWLLLGAFIVGVVAVLAMSEPGTLRPGVVGSLRPHVSVPRGARGAFATAVPGPHGNVGARRLLSVAGTVACRAAAALEELALGRHLDLPAHRSRGRSLGLARQEESVRVMLGGCLALIVGALVTFASIETGTASRPLRRHSDRRARLRISVHGRLPRHGRRGPFRRSGGTDHCDLHRQLPGNWHSGRDRLASPHRTTACTAPRLSTPSPSQSLAAAARRPLGPPNGYRQGEAWNPPSTTAYGARHRPTLCAGRAAPWRRPSMNVWPPTTGVATVARAAPRRQESAAGDARSGNRPPRRRR